ncbi:cupin domain-containing protein [Aquihabitans daechungensis]|uniref:cupin domain-containing protein n=1 Tax=Aquihabitans daechungensis TaxID=1052257 RepID=UPI003BA046E2
MATPTAPTAETPTAPTADPSHDSWLVRRQPHPEAPGLTDLVDDVERFRAHDVHRRPRVTEPGTRRDPARFADPSTLWADLLGRSTRRPGFRLVRDGTTTQPERVTRRARIGNRDLEDLAAPNQVIDGYRDGATVVLQGLHLTDPALARFANNLALELDQPIQINAYLSPASARGLDVHFDYHDVFVIQLEGTKRWRIWSPTDRSRDPIGGKHAIPRPTLDELDDPILDLVLEAGDVLYVPRGHPHVAETTDQASAHLTVGILAITWHRVVRRAVDEAVDAGRLRSSLPLGALEAGPAGAPATAPDLRDLDVDLRSTAVRRWIAREIWSRQAATRLRPRQPLDPCAADVPLTVAPGPLITLSRTGERSVLFVGDRTISMPDEAHPFLVALLRADGPIRRTELPGLDDDSARVVITRLLDEGILVPLEPAGAHP